MIKFLQSIQWRIFVYYTVLIGIAISVLLVGFFLYEKKVRIRSVELELQTKMVGLIPFYFRPGGPDAQGPPLHFPEGTRPQGAQRYRRPEQDHAPFQAEDKKSPRGEMNLGRLHKGLQEDGFYFYAEDGDGKTLHQTDSFPAELLPVSELKKDLTNWDFVNTDTQFFTIQMLPGRGTLIMGQPRSIWADQFDALMLKVTLLCIAVLGVVSFIGFWLIRSSLHPIKEISDTAERIATGDITERIDARGVQSELGKLATVLNVTFGRLGEALGRQIQFTSDASHELRTPVAAILADCQFSLKRERSPERYLETIEVCHESAQHMRSLIENLRDLANFDEANGESVAELVDMQEFLANVVSVMNPLAVDKGIELNSELESAMVQLDPMRMRQAVLNLLGNALRYTEEGGQIIVRCMCRVNAVIIEVHDTGIGIPAEKLVHIFDRFYRADEARAAHTGGVGLGLSISKAIVEANGGAISVESAVGEGTCFRIQLAVSSVG